MKWILITQVPSSISNVNKKKTRKEITTQCTVATTAEQLSKSLKKNAQHTKVITESALCFPTPHQ